VTRIIRNSLLLEGRNVPIFSATVLEYADKNPADFTRRHIMKPPIYQVTRRNIPHNRVLQQTAVKTSNLTM